MKYVLTVFMNGGTFNLFADNNAAASLAYEILARSAIVWRVQKHEQIGRQASDLKLLKDTAIAPPEGI